MNKRKFIAVTVLASILLLAISGCSEGDKGRRAVAKFQLFAQVPADSPYVAASSRPLPEALSKRMLRAASLQQDSRASSLQIKMKQAEDPGKKRFLRLMMAVNEELRGKLTPEGLDSLGFPLNGRSLVYGLGLLPVAWIEIEDGERVNALLDRVEQRAGEPSKRLKLGQTNYRRFDFGELSGIAAVKDSYLVIALLPAAGEAPLLPLALGEKKPEKSLADTGGFADFTESRGFKGYGEGYLDLERLVEMFLGEASGTNAQALVALGVKPAVVSPGCRKLARYLAQSMPRISFGYTEASARGYSAEATLETTPAVGQWLEQMASAVPGLGRSTDATFSMGLALNLPRLREGLKAVLGAILEQGKECEKVDREELGRSLQSVEMMLNPMLAGVKGFDLVLDEIQVDPDTLEPRSVRARLVVAATDPRGIFGMAAMLNPQLATLQIPPDGTPVALPLKQTLPTAPPGWVAIKGEALGLFFGARAPENAAGLLSEPPASPHLLFALNYDVKKLLAQIGPSLERTMQTMQGEEAEDAREVYEAIRQTASLYDRFGFSISGEKRGLVMRGRVEFGKDE